MITKVEPDKSRFCACFNCNKQPPEVHVQIIKIRNGTSKWHNIYLCTECQKEMAEVCTTN